MAVKTPLSLWMLQQPNYIVAVEDGCPCRSEDLIRLSTNWYVSLQHSEGCRWAVYHEDPLEFIAILFALWQLGKTACIPGDNCAGTVERLRSHVDGFVGQFGTDTISCGRNDSCSVNWKPIQQSQIVLEIYTSGSTGAPKSIAKTMDQLEREIEALDCLWPRTGDAVTVSTVSHQHLYGMTFRLFWPLCAEQTFEKKLCLYSEDIYRHAKLYPRYILISSPSHLSRMNTLLEWQRLKGRCCKVISSAAPLLRSDSLRVSEILGVDVSEIYGSSETGAIAWRCQVLSRVDALWQGLPGVEFVYDDHSFSVRAPYLNNPNIVQLADSVEFTAEGTFKLLGRTDRIVKVEGKRVSLSAVEIELQKSELVGQVRGLVIARKRSEIAVVIELSEPGRSLLKSKGRKELIKTLKLQLVSHFEGVLLPRRWRFVESFPYNAQGKVPLDRLENMFNKEQEHWPIITNTWVSGNEMKLDCFAPVSLIYFDGHFAENPVLPGVVQVHWAQAFAQHYLGISGSFLRLEVVKFQQVITPEKALGITLSFDAEKRKLTFRFESEKGVHSSGRICFK